VRRARGFTLLEVMIALVLLSMVMVATIAAMRTLGNTQATIGEVTGRVDEIRVVSQFLRNTVGAAMPVMREGIVDGAAEDAANLGTYFWGDRTHLVWVSPLVAGASMGGTFVMQLAHIDDQLKLKWHSYDKSVEALNWDAVEPRILLDNVEEFELGYLGYYGGEWVEEWTGSISNPVAVRITIMSGGRYWPELVLRLDPGTPGFQ